MRPVKAHIPSALALSLFLALAMPWAAWAQGPTKPECLQVGLKNCKPLDDFTAKLRGAVKNDDRDAVAALISYPIEVQFKDGLEIKDKAAFVRNYDKIMTKAVRDAVNETPFVHPRLIIKFVGEAAEIWLNVDKGRLLIDTIIIE